MLTFNLVLIAVTYYAYYELKARGTLGLVSLDPESETMRDPLIFIAPALFILTVDGCWRSFSRFCYAFLICWGACYLVYRST